VHHIILDSDASFWSAFKDAMFFKAIQAVQALSGWSWFNNLQFSSLMACTHRRAGKFQQSILFNYERT